MTTQAASLQSIFCQDKAIGQLQHAFAAGKMAHAYIFAGADGVGRAATAKAWAKMLLCRNRVHKQTPAGSFYDSCGVCPSCRLFEGEGHADYISISKELLSFTRDGKNRKPPLDMPIDVIREFLIEKVASKPQESEYVVYVIHEAEKLNIPGQNALLKTLEEPPSFCVIILLCSKTESLLPTIHSRCQIVRFGAVDRDHIMAALKQHGITPAAAGYWAGFSDGSLGQALTWARLECDGKSVYDIKKDLVLRLGEFQLANTLELSEWLSQAAKAVSGALGKTAGQVSSTDINRRGQKLIIQMMQWAVYDAMRLLLGLSQGLVNNDQVDSIRSLAGRLDYDRAAKVVLQCQQKIQWIDSSVNEKLIFEGLLFNLAGLDILSTSVS